VRLRRLGQDLEYGSRKQWPGCDRCESFSTPDRPSLCRLSIRGRDFPVSPAGTALKKAFVPLFFLALSLCFSSISLPHLSSSIHLSIHHSVPCSTKLIETHPPHSTFNFHSMACDISMNEAPAVAPSAGYLPRNAIDHMSPFFFKSHSHYHGHAHGHHAHQYSHSHRQHHSSHSPSQDTLSASPTASLQNPTPRRLSAVDPSLGVPTYNTPPATPPLKVVSQTKVSVTSSTLLSPAKKHTGKPVEKDSVAWCTARARIPTPDGSEYFLHIYENSMDKKEHLAFVFGDQIRSQSLDRVQPNETETDRVKRGAYTGRLVSSIQNENQTLITATTITTSTTTVSEDSVMEDTTTKAAGTATSAPLVRIHSECFTGEIGHSARCDCGEQLDEAIRLMKAEGAGVVVYLRQEGRGIGLGEKLK